MTNPGAADPYGGYARIYDLEHASYGEDLAFYANLAARCELPVLELGAGTGRVALHLTRLGHRVTGIDTSAEMLEVAREKTERAIRNRVRFVQADMRSFDLGERFDLAICAYGTFQHLLTTEGQRACLASTVCHLAPGGMLVLAIRPVTSVRWSELEDTLKHQWSYHDEATGEWFTRWTVVERHPATQTARRIHYVDRTGPDGGVRRTVVEHELRYTGRYELEALLAAAGLRGEGLYGDYDLAPYDDSSDLLIAVARRAGED